MSMQLMESHYDEFSGITEEYWYNHLTDELTIRRLQDVEKNIDVNKFLYNEHNKPKYSDSDGLHLVARIPLVMIEHWKKLGFDWFNSTDNERRVWLDKPENQCLKVRPGKLGGVMKKPLQTKVS